MGPSSAFSACSEKGIHRQLVRAVGGRMPPRDSLGDLADFFKLFGDGNRIGILWALSESEMCVCDLCALLNMKQSAVSHQLRTLKQARIVKMRRDGRVIYYSLDDEHIRQVLNLGMEHIQELFPERV
jgi:ArsR family transcriptional regulator